MERVFVPRRKFIYNALHHASRDHRRRKGHQRWTADGLLLTLQNLTGNESDKEYEGLTKPQTVQYKGKREISQDAIFGINLGKAHEIGLHSRPP